MAYLTEVKILNFNFHELLNIMSAIVLQKWFEFQVCNGLYQSHSLNTLSFLFVCLLVCFVWLFVWLFVLFVFCEIWYHLLQIKYSHAWLDWKWKPSSYIISVYMWLLIMWNVVCSIQSCLRGTICGFSFCQSGVGFYRNSQGSLCAYLIIDYDAGNSVVFYKPCAAIRLYIWHHTKYNWISRFIVIISYAQSCCVNFRTIQLR